MRLLYGTGNEAKLESMRRRLSPIGIELIGLKDLSTDVPTVAETGTTPLDNARLKALAYYRAFRTPVFSCDSGLYFDNVPDQIQPGVHVRTPAGIALTDDQMIAYYSGLARRFGDLTARYRNAICLIKDDQHIYESMADNLSGESFIITSVPHSKRVKGFPLDSLSVHAVARCYYYDLDGYEVDEVALDNGFVTFFLEAVRR